MKQMVAAKTEPYWAGYQVLEANTFSSATYTMAGPFAETGRNPDVNKNAIENDVDAAYQNAVMWAITGDPSHAAKAIEILNAWSSTLTAITGSDAILAASLDGFKLANAAEIIRYTNAGWSGSDVTAAENLFKTVFYPVIQNFAPFANGNWTAGCIKAMLAFGIFTDDEAMFSRAINWIENGTDDGALTNYVINTEGQCQESGRDQTHAQLGLGNLAEASETAWHQEVDLYGLTANRLLAGFEYTASYNLGNTVPFQSFTDTTGKYPQTAISPIDRGQFRPIYEMVYNHYQNRRGLACPYTQQVAVKLRPEGAWPYADHPGFGTLLFTKPAGSP
ncbi:MAG TPA: alginate lyase family protein [Polyangia bacterium]|nr:alginate lyase family protein [Polyangia bacterium]